MTFSEVLVSAVILGEAPNRPCVPNAKQAPLEFISK